MPVIAVTKCQGTGNDFVLLDNRTERPFAYAAIARTLCDRRFGVGADGLLVILPARDAGADLAMRIFNADGSEAEACGNGTRCIAAFIGRDSGRERALAIETPSGIVHTAPAGEPGLVRVDMGAPTLGQPFEIGFAVEGRSFRLARVAIGNPHAVIFLEDDINAFALDDLATAVESLALDPGGVNVEIAHAKGHRVHMRVNERGVGETWACGTGACAVAVAAITTGRGSSPIEVVQRGGAVSVSWDGPGKHAFLTGAAAIVFDTTVHVPDDVVASPR